MGWPDRGRKRPYFKNILVGLDQGMGTLFGIDADETLSGYLGREHPNSTRAMIIDWFFEKAFGERNHCRNNAGN